MALCKEQSFCCSLHACSLPYTGFFDWIFDLKFNQKLKNTLTFLRFDISVPSSIAVPKNN